MEMRSFLAFEMPVKIREIVSRTSKEMKKLPLDVRWIRLDNIHITVVFMGDISEDDLMPIGEVVSKICKQYGPFNVTLTGSGIFGSLRNPRVLWIGLDGDLTKMSYFRNSLQKNLKPFGIKEEKRRFKPHLTLGRFRKGTGSIVDMDELLSEYQNITSPTCTVEELILFRSELKPGGAIYSRLEAWPLTGSR
jgi:2'-5' RNA ligase